MPKLNNRTKSKVLTFSRIAEKKRIKTYEVPATVYIMPERFKDDAIADVELLVAVDVEFLNLTLFAHLKKAN